VDTWRLVAAYTLRANVLYLAELKACVPKLCVLYSAVLSCVAACLVCHCNKLRLSTWFQ